MALDEHHPLRRRRDRGRAGSQARRRAEVLSDSSGAAGTHVEVREATSADLAFVRALDADSLAYGIPHTRDVTPEAVRAAAHDAYDDPAVITSLAERFVTLVAERRGAGGVARPVGFIRLDLAAVEPSTGEAQGFILQLAVSRDAWGTGAAHALVGRAAALCAERGITYLVGVVSASNERTLRVATGALEFEVERYQIVKRCRS